ncbi:MAG: phosphate ABC transporter ATP-binding protein [Chloroflexi bacterium]|nr:phosphate ABC transporter ATP-binding protein [Chloroflexota bacterium]
MRDSIYILDRLVKRYGHREACNIAHMEIIRGEILGIIGPSGSGKSTLLRLLNLLEPPTSGSVTFDGTVFDGHTSVDIAVRRRMTMVFQNPLLFNTSVLSNVAYGLKVRGEKDNREKAYQFLDRLGMGDLAREHAATLSYGEAQRVALARALVLGPDVLLLDEPTANLDPFNVGVIEKLILQANREMGTTIVLVTHNVFQARRLAGRVALLLDGREVEVGPTEELFSQARDPRTRAFINGEMVY